MTANPLERAVIDAARSLAEFHASMNVPHASSPAVALDAAVKALAAWEATQDPEAREIGWHEVAEGDQLKSIKNGKFYLVDSTLAVAGGRVRILIRTGSTLTPIIRPTDAEPSAFVKRGQAGAAVDVFVNVFSSGGK